MQTQSRSMGQSDQRILTEFPQRPSWFLISCLLISSFLVFFSQTLLHAQDYNILDYGAKPDGATLCTGQIQAAIDAAHQRGGGRVVVPAGRFLSGSIHLKTNVELHLLHNAVLLGSADPGHYHNRNLIRLSRWMALIMADSQEQISITGKGEIDGQGRKLALHVDSLFYAGQIDSGYYNFAEMRPEYYLRPSLIEFVNCKNVTVKGVTLRNASCWVQNYDLCEDVIIDSIRVDSDAYWNNDGIDISDCKNVRITNSDFDVSDDGICLKSHSLLHRCDNVYIANCTIRSRASAIKFGARSYGGFKNVTIENIKVFDTFRSAIAIECVDGGILEDVLVENVHAVNTGNAIFIRLGKRNKTGAVGTLRNVMIRNLSVSVPFERPDDAYDMRGPIPPFFHNVIPSSITGIPGHEVENVTLENIEIRYPGRGNNGLANMPLWRLDAVPEKIADYPEFSMFGELPAWGFYVRHVDGLTMKNIVLGIDAPDYRPALVFDDVRNLRIDDLAIDGDDREKTIILYNTVPAGIDNAESVLKW